MSDAEWEPRDGEDAANEDDDNCLDDDLDAVDDDDADDGLGDDLMLAPTEQELPAVSYFGLSNHQFKEIQNRLRQRRTKLMEERGEICKLLQQWLESQHYTCVPVVVQGEQQYLRLINTFTRKHLGAAVYSKAVQLLQMQLILKTHQDMMNRREKEYKKAIIVARKAAGLTAAGGRKKRKTGIDDTSAAAKGGAGTEVIVVEPPPPVEPTLAEVLSEAFLQSVKESVKNPRVVVMLSETKERGMDDDDDESDDGDNVDDPNNTDHGVKKKSKKGDHSNRRPKQFKPLASADNASATAADVRVNVEQTVQPQQHEGNMVPATTSPPPRYIIPGDIYAKIERLADIDEELSRLRHESSESAKRLEQNLKPFYSTVMEYVNRVSPATKSAAMRVELPEGDAIPYCIRIKTYRRQPPLNIKDLPIILSDTLNTLRSTINVVRPTSPTTSVSRGDRDVDDAAAAAASCSSSDSTFSGGLTSLLDQPFSQELATQFLSNVQFLNTFGQLITDKSYDVREAKAKQKEITRLTLDKKIVRRGKKRSREENQNAPEDAMDVDRGDEQQSHDGVDEDLDMHEPAAQRPATNSAVFTGSTLSCSVQHGQ